MRLKLPPLGVAPPAHVTEPSFLEGPERPPRGAAALGRFGSSELPGLSRITSGSLSFDVARHGLVASTPGDRAVSRNQAAPATPHLASEIRGAEWAVTGSNSVAPDESLSVPATKKAPCPGALKAAGQGLEP